MLFYVRLLGLSEVLLYILFMAFEPAMSILYLCTVDILLKGNQSGNSRDSRAKLIKAAEVDRAQRDAPASPHQRATACAQNHLHCTGTKLLACEDKYCKIHARNEGMRRILCGLGRWRVPGTGGARGKPSTLWDAAQHIAQRRTKNCKNDRNDLAVQPKYTDVMTTA